jgi:hypothetical protein
MALTEEQEDAVVAAGHVILQSALASAAQIMTDVGPSYDATLDVERVFLTAAAVLMARRARGNRERLMRIVAEQQLFLEARADDAQARAVRGLRP